MNKSPQQRFDEKHIPVPESGCWLWIGAINPGGYGQFWFNGKLIQAHLFSYEQKHGQIPDGLEPDHLCRVHGCVNPDHLEAVTHQENCARGDAGEHHRKKTHCPQGHPYNGENLYINPDGRRECRICRDQRMENHWLRKNPGKQKQISHREKTHCLRGHPFSGDNLHILPSGHRRCRTCHRQRAKDRYHE